VIHAWLDDAPDRIFADSQIRRIKTVAPRSHVVTLPRYDAFMQIVIDLAKQGVRFREFAGNDEILLTAIAPGAWDGRLTAGTRLFSEPLLTNPAAKRLTYAYNGAGQRVLLVEPGGGRAVDPERLFPLTTHDILLQSYMHGVTWGRVDPSRAGELKQSLVVGYTRRFCREERPAGEVEVFSSIRRITEPGNGREGAVRELFLRFSCSAGEPRLSYVRR